MFKVRFEGCLIDYFVYGVKTKGADTYFLMFINNEWQWKNADGYHPVA